MIGRRGLLLAGAGLAAPAALAQGGGTAATQPLRLVLDWALQGNHAMFALAEDRGHYRREGLAVRMDRGFGSGDTIIKVASGAYDLGYAEISNAVKFNADNPDRRVVSIYQVLDRTAAAVIATRRSGIARLADLAGRRVASPAAEASRLLFPVLARANGVDPAAIRWEDVQANLRDPLLAQGRVDAVTGFLFTTHFNLLSAGVREEDIVAFPYAEHGLDLYGSAVIARADWLERNPAAAAGFVRASIAGLRALLADVPAGMEALKRREPLFDTALEARRFAMVRDRSILTPDVRRAGFGALDAARMRTVMEANAEAYGLPAAPAPETLFTDRFLPPQAERMP